MKFKGCPRCKETKPIEDFGTFTNKKQEVKPKSFCKTCANKASVESNAKRDKEDVQAEWRFRKYGISQETYEALLKQQDHSCKICLQAFVKTPVVDHNHQTGEIRGLLCRLCNSAIGFFLDNPGSLQRAIQYLEPR